MKALKAMFKALGAVMLIAIIVSAILIGSAAWLGTPFDHAVIHVDDTSFTIGDLGAGQWLLAFAAIVLACAIVMLVTPLAVLIPLAVAAIGVTVALAIAAAVIGVVFSPLILVALVIWWLVRRSHRKPPEPGMAGSAMPSAQPSPQASGTATIAG